MDCLLYIYYIVFFALGLLIPIACLLLFRWEKGRGIWKYFLLGWAFQILLSLPAGIWQALSGWGYLTIGLKWKLIIPIMGWPFNAAGLSVRLLTKPWCTQAHADWWGYNPLIYFIPMVFQTSLFALLFALRYRKDHAFKDKVIITLAVIFLLNSLANLYYEWLPPG